MPTTQISPRRERPARRASRSFRSAAPGSPRCPLAERVKPLVGVEYPGLRPQDVQDVEGAPERCIRRRLPSELVQTVEHRGRQLAGERASRRLLNPVLERRVRAAARARPRSGRSPCSAWSAGRRQLHDRPRHGQEPAGASIVAEGGIRGLGGARAPVRRFLVRLVRRGGDREAEEGMILVA